MGVFDLRDPEDDGKGTDRTPALFLQRLPYRRRRLIDAARVMPIFAAFLLLVPALLLPAGIPGSTSAMMLFLFGCWGVLIVGAALIARYLRTLEARPLTPPRGSGDVDRS